MCLLWSQIAPYYAYKMQTSGQPFHMSHQSSCGIEISKINESVSIGLIRSMEGSELAEHKMQFLLSPPVHYSDIKWIKIFCTNKGFFSKYVLIF